MMQHYVCFLSILALFVSVQTSEVEVLSSFGRIKGVLTKVDTGKIVYQFRKIPFAVPPVGSLRFQKPLPHPSLSGLYDATEFGPACMQTLPEIYKSLIPNNVGNMSEDCLHLNIYIPNSIVTTPRAVMVFIHGGGFTLGKSTSYDGTFLASFGNVIVVTTNYRLGLFGFMTTEDSTYPGNYGLFDQLEAIRWVKRHIRSFGGDPNKITIFGESAGAYSVGFLATSPLSKGLFQRAIMESGGDLHSYAVQRELRNVSMGAMELLGCLNDTSITSDTKNCMINVHEYQILNASNILSEYILQLVPSYKMAFGPTVDGELIPDIPEMLMKMPSSEAKNVFNSLDIMAGMNSADGGVYLYTLMVLEKIYNFTLSGGIPTKFFCNTLVPSLTGTYFSSSDVVAKKMCGQYTSLDGLGSQAMSILNWYGDFKFTYPMKQLLDFHMHSSKGTFQYLFSKEPSITISPSPLPSWFQGVNHADEIQFVFGFPLVNSYYTQAEKSLSAAMVRYWTNFAKTGNPNTGDDRDPMWLPYKSGRAYLDLDDHISVHHNLYAHRTDFWMSIQDMIGK